jgi:hypothetical protein
VSEAPGEGPDRSVTERAEQIVDRMAQGIGRFTALAGLRIRKVAALTREEAEDMWAEAQSIRQRQSRKND